MEPTSEEKQELRRWFFYTSYQQVFMNSSLSIVRSVFKRFGAFVRHEKETAFDYKEVDPIINMDSRFSLSSAKIDFLMLAEIWYYLEIHPIEAPIYTGYKKLCSETKPQYIVMYVSPTDKRDLQNDIEQKNVKELQKYCLTQEMLDKLSSPDARNEFSKMREGLLIKIQYNLLLSLGFKIGS